MGKPKRFEFPIDFGTWKKENIEALRKIYRPDRLLNTELLINEVYTLKELARLLRTPAGSNDEVLVDIPILEISLTHHNFDLLRHTLNLSSYSDLLLRALTCESAHELVTFTVVSFATFVYSLAFYVIKFQILSKEERIVQFIMNMTAILNLMFLICFIFESCKHGTGFGNW